MCAIKKKYLDDVVLMRLVLIFLLIWYHAFAPFSGHWDALFTDNIPAYKWMVHAVYCLRIQPMIFISGYLLGYIVNNKPERMSFHYCVIKKLKRLWLPGLLFSMLYYMLFYDLNKPVGAIAYSIVNGCGHLWFLPMLFWCFVGVYCCERFKIKPVIVLCTAILLAVMPFPELPLRINSMFNYFIYFYFGYGIMRSYFKFALPNKNFAPVLGSLGVYIIAFICNIVLHNMLFDELNNSNLSGVVLKVVTIASENFFALIMSLSGLLAVYWGSHYFIVGKYKLPDWMINISTYCYGVYICQQFFLKWMYYHTSLPEMCGPYLLPWIALVITLVLSLLTTGLMLKTKAGRMLIG